MVKKNVDFVAKEGRPMNAVEAVDEIHRLMMHLASADWEHRTLPEFLELLEEGEGWVAKMRRFLGDYE